MPATATRKPRTIKIDSVDAKPAKAKSAKAQAREIKHHWAHAGVGLCVTMSAGLNAYANAQHATVPTAGAMLGCMIPALVFILCKVAGMQYRHGGTTRKLAYFTACVGIALLALSVWHCACSLALLTGSHIMLALPMAVAIDGGLVACELDVVLG